MAAIELFPPVQEQVALSREFMLRQHPEVMKEKEKEMEKKYEVVAAKNLLKHLRQRPPRNAREIEGVATAPEPASASASASEPAGLAKIEIVAAAPEPASASASASEPAGLALSPAQLRAHRLRNAGRRS